MDLTDVPAISGLKLLLAALNLLDGEQLRQTELVFLVFIFLPALCIIVTLVYFIPRKVRRSVLSLLNSLSHSPEQTARQTQRTKTLSILHTSLRKDGRRSRMLNKGEKVNIKFTHP